MCLQLHHCTVGMWTFLLKCNFLNITGSYCSKGRRDLDRIAVQIVATKMAEGDDDAAAAAAAATKAAAITAAEAAEAKAKTEAENYKVC